jgi:dephospho-CoA kinase
VKAIVFDAPLLVEAGLDRECDVVVFVEAPEGVRLARVGKSRGWGREELEKREKLQIGLDKKAQVADYCIDNSGDEAASLLQVQRVLSHLFSTSQP